MEIKEIRAALERLKGQQQALQQQRQKAQSRADQLKQDIQDTQEAQAIIQLVARKTQDQLRYRIEEPVTLALNAVFDDPYTMHMEFPIRRNRTECDLVFSRGGVESSDLEFMGGGGAVDVAAFGLQVAVLALMKNHSRPILILDEPLRWLKGGDLPERGAQMIKEISKELGVQVIMVSHIPEQKEYADCVFEVKLNSKRESEVKTILR